MTSSTTSTQNGEIHGVASSSVPQQGHLDEVTSERQQYSSNLELILTLVGYAVGLGNVWRFPYLAYTYGGGAFLVPYFLALILLGLPLFILELGLGQTTRRGTLGMWVQMGLPKWQGVGVAATMCTWLVSLYYNVVLAWTIYYLGRTIGAMPSGVLPWTDQVEGFSCPETKVYPSLEVANNTNLFDATTGLFNASFASSFWCPSKAGEPLPVGYTTIALKPRHCPARAAAVFWESEVLQQSSGLDDLGGLNPGLFLSFTLAWLLVYGIVFKGIESSGKVVYVTATLPYICLGVFLIRAATLPNALNGLKFFVSPDFTILGEPEVWLRAAVQIFHSLGVGYGSLIAFASYGNRKNDFVRDAMNVSFINCGTSVLAGFVVFPILGYLALELEETNPCISGESLDDLKSIGLSGTGLAFIAFPIAISRMPASFFFAMLFFVMLLALGIDSQFAMVETVVTVLSDAGFGKRMSRPALSGLVCFVSYIAGLIFICRGGIYWFSLLDQYSSLLIMFVVTCLECVGLTWTSNGAKWQEFKEKTKEWTGRELNWIFKVGWTWICPGLTAFLVLINIIPPVGKLDLMGAEASVRFPEGAGYLPSWSIGLGWLLALLPIAALAIVATFPSLVHDVKEQQIEDVKNVKGEGKKDHRTGDECYI
eukprot:TRINITY_DN1655_c0_g1_i1.p1 TRINITY_DN1655_c0_g1~~TRINITY_DN1655_c0_g1_i1.p1  ORF type:complete len:652 (-),score=105.10 TRINITY_DN1655_c0_g1_i1:558-2513(-)